MSLDDLELSPYLVKKMYEHSLINTSAKSKRPGGDKLHKKQAADESNSPGKALAPQIPSLGNNKRNILIPVDVTDHAFLAEADLDFLISILNACQVTPDDVAVVNCHNNPEATYEKLIAAFSPVIILFIGTEPQLLGFPVQIPRYRIQHYNGQQYLCAPSLGELSADKEEKKKLWGVLKTLFSIA